MEKGRGKMAKIICILSVMFGLFALPARAQILRSHVLYVDPQGSDTYAVKGDPSSPWQTLRAATNAAKSGELIFVFPGNYADVDHSVGTWYFSPGVTGVTGNLGPIGNGSGLTNILGGYITPYDVGAAGDGSTDDTAALQKWLFIACSSNFVAFLPPAKGPTTDAHGTFYKITDVLLITNGMNHINIKGAGGAVHVSDAPLTGCRIKQFGTGKDGIVITNVQSSIHIENLMMDALPAAYTATSRGIAFDGNGQDSDCSTVKGVGIQGYGKGLFLASVADTEVSGCSFGNNGDGVILTNGTYTLPAPVLNQIYFRGCQFSYNYSNQVHICYGAYIDIGNCDISPQVGASGYAVFIDGHGQLSIHDMHIEPYNGKAAIVATDQGNGPGSVILTLRDMGVSGDGNGSTANTYSIIATNATMFLQNAQLGNASDNFFQILCAGDLANVRSDIGWNARIISGGNKITNIIGGAGNIGMMNQGSLSASIKEGDLKRVFSDYDPGQGAYILSGLYFGSRTFDFDGSLTVTILDLLSYYKDRTVNGAGLGVTNASGLVLYGGSQGGACATNLATVAPNFTVPVSLLPVAVNTTFTAPAGVDVTGKLCQHVVMLVTNSAAGTITLTMPANARSVGSTTVTRLSHLDWWVYAQKFTNCLITPIF